MTATKPHALALAAIAAAAVLLYRALLAREGIVAHDGLDSYLRTWGYLQELRAGHFPPQLFRDAVSGGGYALPRFYPPVANTVSAAAAWLTGDVVLGTHLALLLSVVASGWAMSYLVVRLTGRKLYGVLGALLYVSFPYRFTDVLQRSALAESFTFVWFPLLFAGAWDTIRRERVPWYFPLAVAGLLLTHVTTALYFFVICAALSLLARRQVRPALAARLAVEALAGGALAAWFLLPMAHYLPSVWAGDARFIWATPQFADGNRLTVDLLVHRFPAPNGLDLGVGALGVVLPLLAVLCWRRPPRAEALDRRVLRLAFALALTWVGLIAFMIAPLPALLLLPAPFAYIQFPWRLLGLAGFLASTAVTLLAAALAPSGRGAAAALALGILLAVSVPAAWRPVPMDPAWTSGSVIEIGRGPYGQKGYTILGEYLPRGVPPDSINARVLRGPAASPGVRVVSWAADREDRVAEVAADRPGEVVLPLVSYDMYRISDAAGRRVPARSDGGLLAVRVDAGRSVLRISRTRSPVEITGLLLSALAAIAVLALRRMPLALPPPFPQIDDARPP